MSDNEQNSSQITEPVDPQEKLKSKKEKGPLGAKIIAIMQILLVVPLYVFLAVKSFMMYFSEDAMDYVSDFIDLLDLKDIAISESLLLAGAILFTLLALAVLVSSIFLLFNFKKLRISTLFVSIAAILFAVVFSALMLRFDGEKLFLLGLIPHCGWYGLVVLYYTLKLSDDAQLRAQEKEDLEEEEEYEEDELEESEDVEEEVEEDEVIAAKVETEVKTVRPIKKIKPKVKKKKLKKVKKAKKKKEIDPSRMPKGLIFIAIMHTMLLGVANMVGGIINILATFNEDYDIMFQNFIRSLEVKNIDITQMQLRVVFIVHVLLAILFFVSGIGLFRKSNMMRRFTLNMVIALAIFSALSLVLQGFGSFNPFMLSYFVWFGFVIFYLTRESLDIYFDRGVIEEEEAQDE